MAELPQPKQNAGFSAFVKKFFHRSTASGSGTNQTQTALTGPPRERHADDASVMTLASSSKRRRSLDTNASMLDTNASVLGIISSSRAQSVASEPAD
ncbi:hypothetical protein DASB73_000210 [Starmerella bacillaris]|uniref:Uncharacterized protein n=1 Tax=Starmerella bacillaris TaxID=1247836 RepID=A0AAV5RE99_STABA|nr:hypothetical protein DASB73_000210 [Starmerella bacillaris]